MAAESPGFFSTLGRTFYNFDVYRDAAEDGARPAFKYVVKLSLLAAALGLVAGFLYAQRLYQRVVVPAFADAPALSWTDGRLTADGTVPFKAVIEEYHLAVAVDTRDTPDESLLEGDEVVVLLSADRFRVADELGDLQIDTSYGNVFDGSSFPAGRPYPIHGQLQPPKPLSMQSVMLLVFFGLTLCAAVAVVGLAASVGSLAIMPEARTLGVGGAWSVAVHAMTPAVATLVILFSILLFSDRLSPTAGSFPWALWAVPLVVALVVVWLALRAAASDEPRKGPKPRPPGDSKASIDRDLLNPDDV